MKIALCLSGQPRSYEKGFSYIHKNLLSQYDVDVFLHTWGYSFFNYTALYQLYKPKKLQIDEELHINCNKNIRFGWHSTISLAYSVYSSDILRRKYEVENAFVYDWVIKCRYDFALNTCILFENLSKNKFYFPPSTSEMYVNDQFTIASSYNMNIIRSIYSDMTNMQPNNEQPHGAEYCISNHLKTIGEWNNVERINMNDPFLPDKYGCMCHSLIRDDYDFWLNL